MANIKEIVFSSSNQQDSKKVQRDLKAGQLKVLAPRIFTSNLTDEPEKIVLRNWFVILSNLYPGAILSHRSALEVRPIEGHIYLTYKYNKNVILPGLTIHLLKGPAMDIGTVPFFEHLYRSSEARVFLENMQQVRSSAEFSKVLAQEILEHKLEAIIGTRGEDQLNKIRDEARIIAPALNMQKECQRLEKLIGAILSTRPNGILNSEIAKARAYGEPFDVERVELFGDLFYFLSSYEVRNYKDVNVTDKSYNAFAFFESYFSNFIEGIEFAVSEAKTIIATETPLPMRDEDSHDILGTYRIVSDRAEMSMLPESADHLITILKARHEILMKARTSKNPGQFKHLNNRAGNTEFVDWQLVIGTLKKGFQYYTMLDDPFTKACYMMFLVSEVHPFLDGNGRIARIMMNAELTAKAMTKIIIPTIYRSDYIGLSGNLPEKERLRPM